MEDKFYNDEFEQFLQQQANNHRMYPTDGVWLGIYKKLHGHKKWPALTIAAFTILAATVATSVYFSPKPNIFELQQSGGNNIHNDKGSEKVSGNSLLNPVLSNNITKGKNLVNQSNASLRPILAQSGNNASVDEKDQVSQNIVTHPDDSRSKEALSVAYVKKPILDNTHKLQNGLKLKTEPIADLFSSLNVKDFSDEENIRNEVLQIAEENAVNKKVQKTTKLYGTKDPDDKNIGDNFLKQHPDDLNLFTTTRKLNRRKKFSYTVYIAPSVSYRNLKENKDLNRNSSNVNGPVAANYVTDVNKLVRHKPGTGIETGIAFTYHNSNTFGIKAGLQFNVRQYNIEAFKTPTEPATIALLSNTGVDTINTYAVYRNSNGNLSAELMNRYFQISIPVGIEWEVFGSRNVKFNIAASIQPTYNLNKNLYILSTNFKNYAVNSGMLRDWNINSNIEAFMSIKVGEYRWQLGPQFRYQHLPTFITEYPIREHLMDYGFKLGISKLIK